jgi:hypothetical protein
MALILDGTAGITFPSGSVQNNAVAYTAAIAAILGSRGLPASVVPAGSVLQVLTFSNSAQTTTNSTSWVSTPLTLTITPSSASSKILIFVMGGTLDNNAGTNSQCYLSIFRNNTTNLGNTNYGIVECYANSTTRVQQPASLGYADSPSTTSATTYTVYLRTNGQNNCYYNTDGTVSTITLMEIAQ